MDISMPVMDGFEATRQIRALEATLAGKTRKASTSSVSSDSTPMISSSFPSHPDAPSTSTATSTDTSTTTTASTTTDDPTTAPPPPPPPPPTTMTPPPPRAFIIAMTGLGSEAARAEARASGMDLFLTKPVRFKELSRILEERGFGSGVTTSAVKTAAEKMVGGTVKMAAAVNSVGEWERG